MSHNIDQQTIQIEATINQLLSGLPKTYVPFTDTDILNNKHSVFAQRLEAVCNQDYSMEVKATKVVTRFGWQWLEIENKGKYYYFPDIIAC